MFVFVLQRLQYPCHVFGCEKQITERNCVGLLLRYGDSLVERRTPEREVTPPQHCVLEQDPLLPESTCNTQEAVAPFRHD